MSGRARTVALILDQTTGALTDPAEMARIDADPETEYRQSLR